MLIPRARFSPWEPGSEGTIQRMRTREATNRLSAQGLLSLDEELDVRVSPCACVRPRVAIVDFARRSDALDLSLLLPPPKPVAQSVVHEPRGHLVRVEGHARDRLRSQLLDANPSFAFRGALDLEARFSPPPVVRPAGVRPVELPEDPLPRADAVTLRPRDERPELLAEMLFAIRTDVLDGCDVESRGSLELEIDRHGFPAGRRRGPYL